MAKNQSVTIPAHPNLYNGSNGRELYIEFSVPDAGVTKETGFVIFVPGFGGSISSNVYKKMRNTFADKYNLVAIQCAYFGSEFMQGVTSFTIKNGTTTLAEHLNKNELTILKEDKSALLELLASKSITLPVTASLEETTSNFNDMGYMQAIDIITALEAIKIILKDNNLQFNDRKVIGYGHSHGAYLLHLCNRLAPYLFSYIVDNSAWIEPVYLSNNRYLFSEYGEMTLQTEFDYLAKEIITDKKALNLNTLYTDFDNRAKMIVFQGTNDNLIDHYLKQQLIKSIANTEFLLIDESKVDNYIFKSNTHGLNANHIHMFDYAYERVGGFLNDQEKEEQYTVKLSKTNIRIDHSQGLPVFNL